MPTSHEVEDLHRSRGLLRERQQAGRNHAGGAAPEHLADPRLIESSTCAHHRTLPSSSSAAARRHAQALRHLEEVAALDRANADLFAHRLRTLQRLVDEANAESLATSTSAAGGVGSSSSSRVPHTTRKEEELARLTHAAEAVEEGERAVASLLMAAGVKLRQEVVPHVRAQLAELLGTPAAELPAFPPEEETAVGPAGAQGGSALPSIVSALAATAAALERYLSHDVAPLLRQRHADSAREAARCEAALAEALARRATLQETVAALTRERVRAEQLPLRTTDRGKEEAVDVADLPLAALRAQHERVQRERAWVAEATPMQRMRDALATELAESKAAEAEGVASLRDAQQEAAALVEQLATLERACERRRVVCNALADDAAKMTRERDWAALQATAREEETLALRQALRERQQQQAAVEAERRQAELLLARAQLALERWAAVEAPVLQAARDAAREEQQAAESRLRLKEEQLRRVMAGTAAVHADIRHLREQKAAAEARLIASAK